LFNNQCMFREKRRIAFYGGTFDPPHFGHLQMAHAARDHLRLHQVYFVPAGRNPLKESGPCASTEHRLRMLRLALAGEPGFGIWEGEAFRPGPSYTLESVEHIERVYPNCHLFWIIGSDQLVNLPRWHRVEQLAAKVGFILVRRPGHAFTWPAVPGLRLYPVDNQLHTASATDIRERVRDGRPIKALTPPPVAEYIADHGLYL
jgi:nicotinate-nucleotide adenylyltransferase